jgi:NAD(P)-dependent dehydrogenase (short-subunit alcohol dehydrogenase family)
VHCAATFDQVTISDVDAATWRHVQAVNVEVDRQTLKRRLTPDDTAAAVAYLASDAAAAMTGQVLCADGGLIMR